MGPYQNVFSQTVQLIVFTWGSASYCFHVQGPVQTYVKFNQHIAHSSANVSSAGLFSITWRWRGYQAVWMCLVCRLFCTRIETVHPPCGMGGMCSPYLARIQRQTSASEPPKSPKHKNHQDIFQARPIAFEILSGGQAPPSQTHDPLKISITNAQSVCQDCRWMSLTNENSICNVSLSQWYSYISAYMIRNA